jgi:PleD family two-component response regulator
MIYKILMSDDNGDSYEYLQNILATEADRFIISKTTKTEIYNVAISESPDVILITAETLSRSGIESVMSLKQSDLTHNIPVLLVAKHSPRINLDRIFEYGIVDVVRVPYEKEELLMRIEAAESRKEFQHEIYKEYEWLREL